MNAKSDASHIAVFVRGGRPGTTFIGYMPQVPQRKDHILLFGEYRRVRQVSWRYDEGPHSWEAVLELEGE